MTSIYWQRTLYRPDSLPDPWARNRISSASNSWQLDRRHYRRQLVPALAEWRDWRSDRWATPVTGPMLPYEERLRRLGYGPWRNVATEPICLNCIGWSKVFQLFHGLSFSLGRIPALPVVTTGSYRKGITNQTFGFISFLNAGTASVKMLSTHRV